MTLIVLSAWLVLSLVGSLVLGRVFALGAGPCGACPVDLEQPEGPQEVPTPALVG